MKQLFIVVLLLELLSGCSKKSDVDIQQNFIGTYRATYTDTYTSTTTGSSEVDKGSFDVTVSRGATDKELVFTDAAGSLTVTLNGANFTTTYKRSWAFAPSADIAVSGHFSNNTFTWNETATLTATIKFSSVVKGNK